jgi:hypothetical protein
VTENCYLSAIQAIDPDVIQFYDENLTKLDDAMAEHLLESEDSE